jgi:hypothetical protein
MGVKCGREGAKFDGAPPNESKREEEAKCDIDSGKRSIFQRESATL